MSSQATANARLHHLRSSEISSRARERTATAAPTHSGRRLTYQGGIALDLTGSASHELMPIPRDAGNRAYLLFGNRGAVEGHAFPPCARPTHYRAGAMGDQTQRAGGSLSLISHSMRSSSLPPCGPRCRAFQAEAA